MAVAGKVRLPQLQTVAGLVLLLMSLLIVYMYFVIDRMHQDQQSMRLQLTELQGTGYISSGAFRPDFLPPPRPAVELQRSKSEEEQHTQQQPQVHRPSSRHSGSESDPRQLFGIYSTGQTAGVGCYELDNSATINLDVSSTSGCSGNVCPDCFVTPSTLGQAVALTIQNCGSAQWVRSTTRTGIWMYTIINTHATHALTVTDNSGSPVVYSVPTSTFVQGYCAQSLGTTNKIYWPSTSVPTLTVADGFTLSAGNFDASGSTGTFSTSSGAVTLSGDTTVSGAKTFATGSGTVSLNGATTVADSTTFTVGSSGSGGATTLYGNVNIGSATNTHSVATVVYGTFQQNDDGDGTAKTFTTASGAVSLRGDTTVDTGKFLKMVNTGAGVFETGTGDVLLNGNVAITGSKTFTTGTGAATLDGDTTVSGTKKFTVGASGTAGATTLYGAVTIGSATSGHSVATNVYGDVTFHDDGLTAKTFTTGTGTVSLNGDVSVGANKNLATSGTSSFTTGTGTITFNGNVNQPGAASTFTTGGGAVSIAGHTTIANGKSFTVGGVPGSTTASTFYGTVTIGDSGVGHSKLLTVHGSITQNDDGDGTASTLTTGTGAVSINGDVAVAANKNLHMASGGAGTFQTGTGAISLNGDATVVSPRTLIIGSYTHAIICNHDNTNTAPNNNMFCKASR